MAREPCFGTLYISRGSDALLLAGIDRPRRYGPERGLNQRFLLTHLPGGSFPLAASGNRDPRLTFAQFLKASVFKVTFRIFPHTGLDEVPRRNSANRRGRGRRNGLENRTPGHLRIEVAE